MTSAGWAEKKAARKWKTPELQRIYAAGFKVEHARSVRIVRAKLKAAQYAVEDSGSAIDLAYWDGQEAALSDILTALQRGRGGKG